VREEVHALLRAQGVTTVLVTHDQEEALSLAEFVAVLRDGKIVQKAPPAELYERPLDEPLARFLGAVNVVDAVFEHGTARTPLGALELRFAPGGEHHDDTRADGHAVARARVIVRPEQLEVRARGEAAAEGLAGRIEQCRYFGHDALLHIRPEADGELLLARVNGSEALAVGTPVSVAAHGPALALPREPG
jgi:iron(III) transport system ATP-binding protein